MHLILLLIGFSLFFLAGAMLIEKMSLTNKFSIRPKWKVSYTDCCGAMSLYEEEEFYYAFTKVGAWYKFWKAHQFHPESGYQSNFSLPVMWNDITRVKDNQNDKS